MSNRSTWFFAGTLFLSAALLFQIQLIFAKILLPQVGGAPAVWATAMVFFQSMLLAGYAYAFYIGRGLSASKQALVHSILVLLAYLFLPSVNVAAQGDISAPIMLILRTLVVYLGLPFFLLSTTTPLIQSWFSATHPNNSNPYILYAASNAGSFIGLLTYPFLIEPYFTLDQQMLVWRNLFTILAFLLVAAAFFLVRQKDHGAAIEPAKGLAPARAAQKMRWFIYSFVPASLMLSLIVHIATDIASVPLLWVAVLAIYLLTFVLVFSDRLQLNTRTMAEGLAFCILLVLVVDFWGAFSNSWIDIAFQVLLFFAASMVFHHELSKNKPAPGQAAQYYMYIALGGAAASILNGIVAPTWFNDVYEYNAMLLFAALLLPVGYAYGRKSITPHDILLPLILGLALYAILLFGMQNAPAGKSLIVLKFVIGIGFIYMLAQWRTNPPRFAAGLLAMMLVGHAAYSSGNIVLAQERNFFGVLKAITDVNGRHMLMHGTTLHGAQHLNTDQELWPQTYYTYEGPLGQIMAEFQDDFSEYPIAAAGLGAGSVACYAKKNEQGESQKIVFYEINPDVEKLARNTEYFTYLEKCPAEVVIGDARLSLEQVPDHHYGILILDTFSSDSIPLHMITAEAMEVYKRKIVEGGIIAIHISSRFFDLAPVVAAIAEVNGLHAVGLRQDKSNVGTKKSVSWWPSQWIMVTEDGEKIERLLRKSNWKKPEATPDSLWTDNYSSLWSALKADLMRAPDKPVSEPVDIEK